MRVRALSTIIDSGQIRRPGDIFAVAWRADECRRYETEGLVEVLEWGETPRAVLGTAGDGGEAMEATEEPPEVPFEVRTLLDAEDEGHDVAAMLEASRVDDLRAIANDMAIPNLHGRMTKAALIEAIVTGLDEQRERYAARTAWEDAQAEG